MSIVKKLAESVIDGLIEPPSDPTLEESCPLLWELFTMCVYGDKERTRRILPELVLTRVSGGWKCVVRDHETCNQMSCFSSTLAEVGPSLEAALRDSRTVWEAFRSYRNKKGPHVPENGLTRKVKKG